MRVYLHKDDDGVLEVSTKDLSSETVIVNNVISKKKVENYYHLLFSWDSENDEETYMLLSDYFTSDRIDTYEKFEDLLAEYGVKESSYDKVLGHIKESNIIYKYKCMKDYIEDVLHKEGYISDRVNYELSLKLELSCDRELEFVSTFEDINKVNFNTVEAKKKLVYKHLNETE